jgi:putative transposase
MNFEPEQLYHIYNRGNNKQKIFFTRENYLFFLSKVRKNLLAHFDILAYCLMPNHFHFLVFTKADIDNGKAIRSMATLLSSYTRAINIQENKTGSLFQQKTKAKPLLFQGPTGLTTLSRLTSKTTTYDYPFICFNYIHQNSLIAGLVQKMEDWEFSSFRDYAKFREGTLCNKERCKELLEVEFDKEFYEESYRVISEEKLKQIF